MSPTPRQAAVLAAVERLTAAKGFCPTFREVAAAAGVSLSTARQKIAALERRGLLQHDVGACRSLRRIKEVGVRS
jgi:hypothetical protein